MQSMIWVLTEEMNREGEDRCSVGAKECTMKSSLDLESTDVPALATAPRRPLGVVAPGRVPWRRADRHGRGPRRQPQDQRRRGRMAPTEPRRALRGLHGPDPGRRRARPVQRAHSRDRAGEAQPDARCGRHHAYFFSISPDSQKVVYTTGPALSGATKIYAVPIAGGPRVDLVGAVVPGGGSAPSGFPPTAREWFTHRTRWSLTSVTCGPSRWPAAAPFGSMRRIAKAVASPSRSRPTAWAWSTTRPSRMHRTLWWR